MIKFVPWAQWLMFFTPPQDVQESFRLSQYARSLGKTSVPLPRQGLGFQRCLDPFNHRT